MTVRDVISIHKDIKSFSLCAGGEVLATIYDSDSFNVFLAAFGDFVVKSIVRCSAQEDYEITLATSPVREGHTNEDV